MDGAPTVRRGARGRDAHRAELSMPGRARAHPKRADGGRFPRANDVAPLVRFLERVRRRDDGRAPALAYIDAALNIHGRDPAVELALRAPRERAGERERRGAARVRSRGVCSGREPRASAIALDRRDGDVRGCPYTVRVFRTLDSELSTYCQHVPSASIRVLRRILVFL